MKILMINHFPLEGSGSGTYTKNLAVHLAEKGHEITIIMPENTTEYPSVAGVKLHPVFFTNDLAGDKPMTLPGEALPFNFPCFTSHPRSNETFAGLTDEQLDAYKDAFAKAINEEIMEFAPDVIHGQHVWILPALAAGKGVPLVLTAHGTDLMGHDKWPGMREYGKIAMDACTNVISISKDNCDLLQQIYPEYTEKIVMMKNGYNAKVFHPKELDRGEVLKKYGLKDKGMRIVLFAGKLAHFKGVDVLLDAAAMYEKDLPDVVTLIAGDGDEREKLLARAKELGLSRVHFLMNVDQEALSDLYAIADTSLVPSRREPFGLVAIEAMGCGTPVIATNQGGLPDFVNDDVGALVEPEDAAGLTSAVEATLVRTAKDPTWREAIAKYAYDNYSQGQMIKELVALYEKAVRMEGHK